MQAGYVSWFSLWEVVKLSLYTRHPQLRRGGGSTLNEMSLSKPWKGRDDWLCKSIYRTVVIYSEYSSPPPLPVDSSWSVFFFPEETTARNQRSQDVWSSAFMLHSWLPLWVSTSSLERKPWWWGLILRKWASTLQSWLTLQHLLPFISQIWKKLCI